MKPPWPSPQGPRPWGWGRILGTQAPVSLVLFLILPILNFLSPFRANDRKNLSTYKYVLPSVPSVEGTEPPSAHHAPPLSLVSWHSPGRALPTPPSTHTAGPSPFLPKLGHRWASIPTHQQTASYLFNKLKQGNSFQTFRDKPWTACGPD